MPEIIQPNLRSTHQHIVLTQAQWTTSSGAHCKNGSRKQRSRTSASCNSTLGRNGMSWISSWSTKRFDSSEGDFELVWLQGEDTLNPRFTFLTSDVLCLNFHT
jgi:hypothetical protein